MEGGAEENVDITAVDAVYEPNIEFIYFLADQRLYVFDPTRLTFGGVSDIEITSPPAIPELTAPAFITWAQPVKTPAQSR